MVHNLLAQIIPLGNSGRASQMQADEYGLVSDVAKNTLVVGGMQDYVDKYKLKANEMKQKATEKLNVETGF